MLRKVTQLLALVSLVWGYGPQSWRDQPKYDPLPTNVTPHLYFLELFPRIPEGYFNGTVQIHVKCAQPTDVIVLHAHQDLHVFNVSLLGIRGSGAPAVREVQRNESADTLRVELDEDLQEGGVYRLRMQFYAQLRNVDNSYSDVGVGGFYRGSYEDESTQTRRWFAMTSTFPRSARRVFPCFDEPSFKARFWISVARFYNMTALSVSDTAFVESTDEEGYIMQNFWKTPRIATFSVGVLVSELGSKVHTNVTSTQGSLALTVYNARFEQTASLQQDTKLVPQVLQELQDYLGIGYPPGIDKLDLVGLPRAPYVMETGSLGLIVTQDFMVNDRYPDLHYALVRQWVGHMVTPENWGDFNVSEILTAYLARHVQRKVLGKRAWMYPDSRDRLYDLYSTNVNKSDYAHWPYYDVEQGVWFLDMLNSSIGEKTLSAALGNFLKTNQFGSLTESSLWAAVTRAAGPEVPDVEQMAHSWTAQRFPVLTVTRQYDDGSAALEQHVFSTQLPRAVSASDEQLLWTLPIAVLSPSNPNPWPATWMTTRHLHLTDLPGPTEYIAINHHDSGMFLVNYDVHNWRLLQQNLAQLPSKTRAKLLHDALLLAAGGELDYGVALNMTARLGAEQDSAVLTALVGQLSHLEPLYSFTRVHDKLDVYLRDLLTTHFDPEVFPDYETDSNYANFWYTAKERLFNYGYQPRIDQARESLQAVMPTFLVNDTISQLVLFCPEFMRDESSDWKERVEQLQNFIEGQYEIRSVLERGLARCPGYEQLVNRILNHLLEDDAVFSSSNWYGMLNLLAGSRTAQDLFLDFFLEHYSELRHRFYFMQDMWTNLVTRVTAGAKTEDTFSKLTEFYKEHEGKLGYTQSVVEKAIKQASTAYEWGRKNLEDIELWLDHNLQRARAE